MNANPSIKLFILIQSLRIRRRLLLPLPHGGDHHLSQSDQRTPSGFQLPIKRRTGEEGDDRQRHGDGGNAESPSPADVVLDVNDDGEGGERGQSHAEVVEVEKVPAALGHAGAGHVELVGGEGDHAGADAGGAEGGEEEGDVEDP